MQTSLQSWQYFSLPQNVDIPLEEAEKFVEREAIHKVYVEEISSYIRNNLDQVQTYMAQAPPEPVPVMEQPVPAKVEQAVVTKHLPMVRSCSTLV